MTTTIDKANDRIAEASIDDEIVVMSLDSGSFFALTGTARDIWRALDGTRDREAIVTELAARYDADRAAVSRDVDEFLAELREAGLLAE